MNGGFSASEIRELRRVHPTAADIDRTLAAHRRHCDLLCGKFGPWCERRCKVPRIVALLKNWRKASCDPSSK